MKPATNQVNRSGGHRGNRGFFALLALLAVASAALIANVSPAAASTSNFCGGTLAAYLSPGYSCQGAARTLYAEEGWGVSHSVCTTYTLEATTVTVSCSSGPGAHTYHNFGAEIYTAPGLFNQGGTATQAQGVAYT